MPSPQTLEFIQRPDAQVPQQAHHSKEAAREWVNLLRTSLAGRISRSFSLNMANIRLTNPPGADLLTPSLGFALKGPAKLFKIVPDDFVDSLWLLNEGQPGMVGIK